MKDFLTDEEMMKLESQSAPKQKDFLTESEMLALESANAPKPSSFIQRLKGSFGDDTYKNKNIVEGKNGTLKEFAGDVADMVGPAIPFATSLIGAGGGAVAGVGVGAIPGAAIGAASGESLKQGIGHMLGVRGDTGLGSEVKDVALSGALTWIGGKTGSYVVSRLPKLLGIFSGEGDDVIRSALQNPKAADLGLANGDDALHAAVQEASKKSVELRTSFVQAHNEAFKELTKEVPGKLVSRQKVLYGFVDALKREGVKIKDGTLDFTTSKIKANPGEVTKITDTYKAIQAWDDWTLSGTNKLKQLVGSFTRFADEAGTPSKSPFLGQFYHTMDTTIKNALPSAQRVRYSVMNKKFSDSIDMFDDMVEAFNKGDPFTRMAGVIGNNKDTLRRIVEFYDNQTGAGIKSIVAGRALGQEKNAAFGFLNPRSWIDFMISPKLQGQIITKTGRVTNPIVGTAQSMYNSYQSGLKTSVEEPLNRAFRSLKFGK